MIDTIISKDYYEVFEIHTTPRKGVVCLVLRINRKGAKIRLSDNKVRELPVGAMCTFVSDTEQIPDTANFIPSTIYFNRIHKKVDMIKEALANKNLLITINNKEYAVN